MLRKSQVALVVVAFMAALTSSCDTRWRTTDAEPAVPSGGGSAPNGSDPKQPAIRGNPTATIPASPSGGVPTLGLGVGGADASSPMQPLSTTVFAPAFTFASSEDFYERNSSESVGTRVHASSNSWSAGVSGGVGWFSAGVRRRQQTESFLSESSRDFQGSVRLLKQRNFLSLASGHFALNPDVMTRIAAAQAARQAQNWTQLAAERTAFEAIYGIGFVSETVLGHSMHLRAYATQSATNASAVNSFATEFSTPFVSGNFSNLTVVQNFASSAGCTIQAAGIGMVVNPTSIATFYTLVDTFYSNLSAPAALWAGCIEYSALPAFDAFYAPITGVGIVPNSFPVAAQTIQLPVLGAVGEMVSRDSFSQTVADTVWLSPYLFPGPHSISGTDFVLQVRAFDLLKVLSRDAAFRNTGLNFLAARGYPVQQVAQALLMPTSPGGPGSVFPEYVGEFYKSNVEQIRPRLSIVQVGTGLVVDVPGVATHWQPVPTMGLDNFGGPGSNTCGLFYGAGNLQFVFPDVNGEIAQAAQQGRLRLGTEVAKGVTSIRLTQSKTISGDFVSDVWNPSLNWATDPNPPNPGFATGRIYPGTKKAVLIRWPAQAEYTVNMSAASASTTWANSAWVGNWQESQDISWNAPGYWYPAYPGCPFVSVVSNPGGVDMPGAYFAIQGDSVTLNPIGFGSNFLIAVYGNNHLQPGGHTSNTGTYLSLLILGQ